MEIVVAILVIALIGAVVFAVMQRRPGGGRGLGRPRSSPVVRRDRAASHPDPMATAVAEHAEATDPQDVVAAEERLRAQARQVAAPLNSEAQRKEDQRVADEVGSPVEPDDPATDPRYDGRGRDV